MRTRKLFIYMLALSTALTACTNDDNVACEQQSTQGAEARTYTVNIAATIAGDDAQTRTVTFDNDATPPTATGRFGTTENIYVYNETKGAMLDGLLHPTAISADGKHCQLTGTLTGTIDANDKLILAYNMNSLYTLSATSLINCFFDYGSQKGTGAGIIDGGLTPSLTAVSLDGGVLTTQETATFAMQQAIFRLKFTDGTNAITVKSLLIESTGDDISVVYWPFLVDHYSQNKIIVSPTTPTSEYLYVSVCIKESATPTSLNFTVTDNNGYQYKGTKAAPSGGFKNGKYYYSSAATALTKQTSVKPAITWTSVKDNTAVEPNVYYCYKVWGPWNGSSYTPSEITISGTSAGYYFFMENDATIHLSSLTATYDDDSPFILSNDALNLDISGENIIYCKSWSQCVYGNSLKLSGNGTLTVTANVDNRCGLFGDTNYTDSNNLNSTTTEVDVTSLLAAPGYTVTRSARTNNGDNTYTWTYTVAPTTP